MVPIGIENVAVWRPKQHKVTTTKFKVTEWTLALQQRVDSIY
jgi:hypothetical protein